MDKLTQKICRYGFLFFILIGCNTEYNTVGIDLIATDQFQTQTREFPVYVQVDTLDNVQASQFSVAHFGRYNFHGLGRSEASITSQLSTFPNPAFGLLTQALEEEGDETNPAVIDENEQVETVYLEIPFVYNQTDSDNDGVIDAFDTDPLSNESDSDGDGISDLLETQAGTNPLDQDSDGDGILDGDDDDNSAYTADERLYDIEHLYGDTAQSLRIKVVELTHFFTGLDPDNNFETTKIYFSDRDYYTEGFVGQTLFDGDYTLNLEELLFYFEEDDAETLDVDETQEIETRLSPRLRIPLDPNFFQENLLDREGDDVLANQNNFNQFFKALHIRLDEAQEGAYMLLNTAQARVVVNYTYDRYEDQDTDDTADDEIVSETKSYALNFSGVQINHMAAAETPPTFTAEEKLPIKGGLGTIGKIALFDRDSLGTVLDNFKSTQLLINEANLVFYVDPDFAANWNEGDPIAERLFLYMPEGNMPLQDYYSDDSNSATLGFKYLHGGNLEYQDGRPYRYKFRITQHVSSLVRATEENPVDNDPLALVVTSDINNINLRKAHVQGSSSTVDVFQAAIAQPLGTILVGPSPAAESNDLRLRLEIIYTDFSN